MSDPVTAGLGAADSLFSMIATVAARDPEAQRIGANTRRMIVQARIARRDKALTSAEREKAERDERRRSRQLAELVVRWRDAIEDGHAERAERIAAKMYRKGVDPTGDDEVQDVIDFLDALEAKAAERA